MSTEPEVIKGELVVRDNRASQMSTMDQGPPMSEVGQLVRMAMQQNVGIETLRELLKLKREEEAEQARRSYVADLAKAKQDLPLIHKDKRVYYEAKDKGKPPTDYRHATLGQICSIVGPILGKHGLTWSWPSSREADRVKVVCKIQHRDGHSESGEPLFGPPDSSGSKNNIQALGSTLTYLQRYTLQAALGLGFVEDDDGRASTPPEDEQPEQPEQQQQRQAPREQTKPAAQEETRPAKREPSTLSHKYIYGFKKLSMTVADMELLAGVAAPDWTEKEHAALHKIGTALTPMSAQDRQVEIKAMLERAAGRGEPEDPADADPGEPPDMREPGEEG